jgi:hypothetical protein
MKRCPTCQRRYRDEDIFCVERGHEPLVDESVHSDFIRESPRQAAIEGSGSVCNVIGAILILLSLAMSVFVIWRLAHIYSPASDKNRDSWQSIKAQSGTQFLLYRRLKAELALGN